MEQNRIECFYFLITITVCYHNKMIKIYQESGTFSPGDGGRVNILAIGSLILLCYLAMEHTTGTGEFDWSERSAQ